MPKQRAHLGLPRKSHQRTFRLLSSPISIDPLRNCARFAGASGIMPGADAAPALDRSLDEVAGDAKWPLARALRPPKLR